MCHQLHYLQMVTEKLSKAYFWRKGKPPAKSHAGFHSFLRALGTVPQAQRPKLVQALEFKNYKVFQAWIKSVLPLADALERLAPALALNGPNPEYPWPPDVPAHAPADFAFPIWSDLNNTGRGRELIKVVLLSVDRFPVFA